MPTRALHSVLHYVRSLTVLSATPDLGDAVLLRRFVDFRDEAALATLLQRHGPLVFATCHQVLHDPHAAEDAFQATFLVLARKACSLRIHGGSLAPWLHRVAYRAALKIQTAARRRQAHETKAASRMNPIHEECPPEWLPWLHEEINRLPARYREPVVLCFLQGRTQQEAATELGRPLGTVGSRLNRARDLLQRRLVRRGLAPCAAGMVIGTGSAAPALPPTLLGVTTQAALRFAAPGSCGEGLAGGWRGGGAASRWSLLSRPTGSAWPPHMTTTGMARPSPCGTQSAARSCSDWRVIGERSPRWLLRPTGKRWYPRRATRRCWSGMRDRAAP